jgi:3-dehydroquinate dehydratase II
MAKLLALHGPNLNLLGKREPEIYGAQTLSEINTALIYMAMQLGHELECFQSNAEHELIEKIQSILNGNPIAFIITNPGAYTHTSIALRDALLAVKTPFIEVHFSNVHARETYRQHSYLSDIAVGVICGLGAKGYEYALQAADHFLENNKKR